jgi:hypothetical protein
MIEMEPLIVGLPVYNTLALFYILLKNIFITCKGFWGDPAKKLLKGQ